VCDYMLPVVAGSGAFDAQQRCVVQVAPKEVLFPKLGLSRATGRCLSYPPMPLQATAVKLGTEFPEPADALDKLERQVPFQTLPSCFSLLAALSFVAKARPWHDKTCAAAL